MRPFVHTMSEISCRSLRHYMSVKKWMNEINFIQGPSQINIAWQKTPKDWKKENMSRHDILR